jgi:hypothetical protein
MKKGTQTYHIKDIWNAYSMKLLSQNPEWWGRAKHGMPAYNLYRKYTDAKGKLCVLNVLDYGTFSEVIRLYFERAKEEIIQGKSINMFGHLGKIYARRVERNFKNKAVNFKATSQQPLIEQEDGSFKRAKIIYYTSDDWCRISWYKPAIVANKALYEFKPTKNLRNGKGFNQMLDKALTENKALRYRYPYFKNKKDHK